MLDSQYLHHKTCALCQQPFTTRYRHQRYCSGACWFRAHPSKPPRWPRWTDEETRLLRELAGQVPARVIAERIGRTHPVVKARAHLLKIDLRLFGERCPWAKHSDAVVEQARTLHDEGMGPEAIARHLNIPRSSVRNFIYYQSRLGPPVERYV